MRKKHVFGDKLQYPHLMENSMSLYINLHAKSLTGSELHGIKVTHIIRQFRVSSSILLSEVYLAVAIGPYIFLVFSPKHQKFGPTAKYHVFVAV